jgi:tetratricopeptide (TPR) repeat protein
MMRKSQFLIYIVLVVSVTGCAQLIKKPPEKIVEAPEEKPPVEAPEERFVKECLQKGLVYEDKGDMVAALKQYKMSMTVDPRNQEAIENRNRVEIELRNLAEEHYMVGLKFHKQGKYGLAHHQFLVALRLWPDYPEVANMLTSRKRLKIKRYIVHTIKPGESLSKVANIYYGDYHKFPIIAKYNNITDATRIKIGQKIKVPEIEGREFLFGKEAIEEEKVEVADAGFRAWERYALEAQKKEEEPEVEVKEEEKKPEDQIAIYRDHGVDLFRKKKYREAIVVFSKVLNERPEDSIALEYSYKSHFQEGITLFSKKDYLAARDQFEVCLRYKTDCQKCHGYIKESEYSYKEIHYKKGIQFFNNELLTEAIREWRLVKLIDPDYKRVNYLISKANTILKKVKQLKESQEEKL